jgi:hypothetical protein
MERSRWESNYLFYWKCCLAGKPDRLWITTWLLTRRPGTSFPANHLFMTFSQPGGRLPVEPANLASGVLNVAFPFDERQHLIFGKVFLIPDLTRVPHSARTGMTAGLTPASFGGTLAANESCFRLLPILGRDSLLCCTALPLPGLSDPRCCVGHPASVSKHQLSPNWSARKWRDSSIASHLEVVFRP